MNKHVHLIGICGTAMASLAGLPFTAGFFGKFLIFTVALAQHQFLLVGLGVVAVACGFYYYLRVVRAMYFQPATIGPEVTGPIPLSFVTQTTIALLIAAILVLGVYPQPALGLLEAPVAHQAAAALPAR